MSKSPIRVAVTGGAGQICYSLLFRIANGDLFGPDQPVALNILELPVAMKALEGAAMELNDCAFPLLTDIVLTSKPRGAGMERADLIRENGPIFTGTGKAINDNAADDVRIIVVGNPCNTNCLIAMNNAPDIPNDRFHAMTRLDQNRAVSQIANKAGVAVTDVENLVIWGNHSANQVPDYANAKINGQPVTEVIKDLNWLQNEFIPTVGKRGAAIIAARGKSSAASAASATIDAVRQLTNPTPDGQVFSSAVLSDGNPYGIPGGLVFSFPLRSNGDGNREFVEGFEHDDFLKEKIKVTTDELLGEKEVIKDLL